MLMGCHKCRQPYVSCVCTPIPFFDKDWRPINGGVYKLWHENIPIVGVMLKDKTEYSDFHAGGDTIVSFSLWDLKRKCIQNVIGEKKILRMKNEYRGINCLYWFWIKAIYMCNNMGAVAGQTPNSD